MFLRPQHFQQHERYLEFVAHARSGAVRATPGASSRWSSTPTRSSRQARAARGARRCSPTARRSTSRRRASPRARSTFRTTRAASACCWRCRAPPRASRKSRSTTPGDGLPRVSVRRARGHRRQHARRGARADAGGRPAPAPRARVAMLTRRLYAPRHRARDRAPADNRVVLDDAVHARRCWTSRGARLLDASLRELRGPAAPARRSAGRRAWRSPGAAASAEIADFLLLQL